MTYFWLLGAPADERRRSTSNSVVRSSVS